MAINQNPSVAYIFKDSDLMNYLVHTRQISEIISPNSNILEKYAKLGYMTTFLNLPKVVQSDYNFAHLAIPTIESDPLDIKSLRYNGHQPMESLGIDRLRFWHDFSQIETKPRSALVSLDIENLVSWKIINQLQMSQCQTILVKSDSILSNEYLNSFPLLNEFLKGKNTQIAVSYPYEIGIISPLLPDVSIFATFEFGTPLKALPDTAFSNGRQLIAILVNKENIFLATSFLMNFDPDLYGMVRVIPMDDVSMKVVREQYSHYTIGLRESLQYAQTIIAFNFYESLYFETGGKYELWLDNQLLHNTHINFDNLPLSESRFKLETIES